MPTVIAVDDDPMILALLEVVAESRGLEFIGCGTGAEFDATLGERTADLVIIDGLLPDTSGLKLAQRVLRRAKPRPQLLFLSAFFKDVKSSRKLRTLRVDKVLHKPVDPHDLGRAIDALLDTEEQAVRKDFDIGERLRVAGDEYRRDLPEKAAELAQSLGAAAGAPDLEGLRTGVHRVAGSAGAYGLPGLSAIAAGLDARLQAGKPVDSMRGEIAHLVEEMRGAASVPAAPPSSGHVNRWPWTMQIVSGDEAWRARLQRQLESEGKTVKCVDALAGLSRSIRSFVPDAIVVDVQTAGPRERRASDILTTLPSLVLLDDPSGDRTVARDVPGRMLVHEFHIAYPTPYEGAYVLSIDDDPTVATMCDAVLTPLGFLVEWADGFAEACEAMVDRSPDMVLLDLTMPEMNGFQICRFFRNDERWSDVPIIILSSRSGAEDRASATRAGANDYMVKPVTQRELVAKVVARIRERWMRDLLARIDP